MAPQGSSEPSSSASPASHNHFTVIFAGSSSGECLKRKTSQQIPWYVPNYSVLPARGFAALLGCRGVWKAQGWSAVKALKPDHLQGEYLSSLTLRGGRIHVLQELKGRSQRGLKEKKKREGKKKKKTTQVNRFYSLLTWGKPGFNSFSLVHMRV